MSWNDRATRKLHDHARALLSEARRPPDLVPPSMQVLNVEALRSLVELLIDNVDPTVTPVREFIDKRLGGA